MQAYILKRIRGARHARIAVHEDGRVLVTAPKYVAKRWVEAFVQEQREWIQKRLATIQQKPKTDLNTYSRDHFLRNKVAAKRLVNKKLEQWNAQYQFSYTRVTIRSMRTRWGSCSSSGNLSFNYKVLFLAEELQDYLIVHELCHLQEMNHSKRFWDLVARAIPDYKDLRKQLRVHG